MGDERDLSYAAGCIAIALYIAKHGSITFGKAKRVSGSRDRKRVWRMLREIDTVMEVYRQGTGRKLLERE